MESATRATVKAREQASPRRVEPANETPRRSSFALADTLVLVLLGIGGVNWGLVGAFGFDAVAWIFGPGSIVTRAIYVGVGLAAVYCLYKLEHWSRAG